MEYSFFWLPPDLDRITCLTQVILFLLISSYCLALRTDPRLSLSNLHLSINLLSDQPAQSLAPLNLPDRPRRTREHPRSSTTSCTLLQTVLRNEGPSNRLSHVHYPVLIAQIIRFRSNMCNFLAHSTLKANRGRTDEHPRPAPKTSRPASKTSRPVPKTSRPASKTSTRKDVRPANADSNTRFCQSCRVTPMEAIKTTPLFPRTVWGCLEFALLSERFGPNSTPEISISRCFDIRLAIPHARSSSNPDHPRAVSSLLHHGQTCQQPFPRSRTRYSYT